MIHSSTVVLAGGIMTYKLVEVCATTWATTLLISVGLCVHSLVAQATIDFKRLAAFSTAYNIMAIHMI